MNKEISMNMDTLFVSPVYSFQAEEYIDLVSAISEKALKGQKKDNIYPVTMSHSLLEYPELENFRELIGTVGYQILHDQGYDMSNLEVFFTEMWCQKHHKYSSMEYHVHPNCHLVGFYFIDCPPESSKVIFHDPRPGKLMNELYQSDINKAKLASSMINFNPSPGMIMITNSWLPHSFTRNPLSKPFKFIHFNLAVREKMMCNITMPVPTIKNDVEII